MILPRVRGVKVMRRSQKKNARSLRIFVQHEVMAPLQQVQRYKMELEQFRTVVLQFSGVL